MAVISEYEDDSEVKKSTAPAEASGKPTPVKAGNANSSYAAAATRGHAAASSAAKAAVGDSPSAATEVSEMATSSSDSHEQILGTLLQQHQGEPFEMLRTVFEFLGAKTELLTTEGTVTKVNDLIWDIKSKKKAVVPEPPSVAKTVEAAKPPEPEPVQEEAVKPSTPIIPDDKMEEIAPETKEAVAEESKEEDVEMEDATETKTLSTSPPSSLQRKTLMEGAFFFFFVSPSSLLRSLRASNSTLVLNLQIITDRSFALRDTNGLRCSNNSTK